MPRLLRHMDKVFFNKHASAATIHTFSNDNSDDAYGDPSYTETTTSVTGILSFARRSSRVVTEAAGIQYVIEGEFFVRDAEFNNISGIDIPMDPDDDRRPYLTVGQADYDIFEVEQPGHGITRLILIKRRQGG